MAMLYKRLISQPPFIAPTPGQVLPTVLRSTYTKSAWGTGQNQLGFYIRNIIVYNVDPLTGQVNTNSPAYQRDLIPSGQTFNVPVDSLSSNILMSPNGRKFFYLLIRNGQKASTGNNNTGWYGAFGVGVQWRAADGGGYSNVTSGSFAPCYPNYVVWASDNVRFLCYGGQGVTRGASDLNPAPTYYGSFWGQLSDAGALFCQTPTANIAFTKAEWFGNDVVIFNGTAPKAVTYGSITPRNLTILGDTPTIPTSATITKLSETRFLASFVNYQNYAIVTDFTYDGVANTLTGRIVTNTLMGNTVNNGNTRIVVPHMLDDDRLQLYYFDGVRQFQHRYVKSGTGPFIKSLNDFAFPPFSAAATFTSHSSGNALHVFGSGGNVALYNTSI
jgi:hypothetical protein